MKVDFLKDKILRKVSSFLFLLSLSIFLTFPPQMSQSREVQENLLESLVVVQENENCYNMGYENYFSSSCYEEDLSDDEFEAFLYDPEIDTFLDELLPDDSTELYAGILDYVACLITCRNKAKRLPIPKNIKRAWIAACVIKCQVGW